MHFTFCLLPLFHPQNKQLLLLLTGEFEACQFPRTLFRHQNAGGADVPMQHVSRVVQEG